MKKVLAIGYVWPEPNSSAAGSHMMSLLRLFKRQGWSVEFATPAQETEHMIDLSEEGITSQSIQLNCDSFDQYIEELQPDVVMFDRFMMEEQFGWRVEKVCPNAFKLLDTEDLQFLRNARHEAVKKETELTKEYLYSDLAKREIAAILRCDLSLIISSYEMELLQSEFNIDSKLLHHLPFMVDLNTLPENTKSFEERKHFMTIGNFRHAPNWDAVLQLQKIWPKIRKQLPDSELHIYGSYPPPKATALHNPKTGFHIKGWAKDAQEVMEQARVCVAPLRFGAGIKGKLLDAMKLQTPNVTSEIGSEGMLPQGKLQWPGAVADDIDEFVEQAVALYKDEDKWLQAQSQCHSILEAYYEQNQLGDKLIERLIALDSELDSHRLDNFFGSMLKHHSMASTKYMSQWIAEKNKIK
ncbi:glycosyl transferase family 1 [Vibrio crassostreae]|uniref:glycosyltransferase n=1 Tax=Vibrio crassostreae TaxID=246167 RepID=UPI000F4904AB|nr:glycosyltransferase family 4 protein [Vibrio crassostreae]ROR27540.1 glycosyl transferase family 1 [Vibrio crassostreae]TCN74126.1 glycosyl transferase family 1 [Vibrio crassostreae]TWD63878.1 glycosyl transferase family 1 [Vibrio crassostreae]CAK1841138.1 Glycosyltransferase family 4 protein [Vibrio crassostreae]CAK2320747.1 Glycosyltransferase family 4 protein [Vibrio crassostreae]